MIQKNAIQTSFDFHKNKRQEEALKRASVYTDRLLSIYDNLILRFENRWIWKCPSSLMLDHYNRHVSSNHLDVGVGSGYFLDRCRFPEGRPIITLMDLSENSLRYTSERIRRYNPETLWGDVLEPVSARTSPFGSIGLNYLLHCVPGDMTEKSVVFSNLKPLLREGGVLFGSTILGKGVPMGFSGKLLMNLYNARMIFSNREDDLAELDAALGENFSSHKVRVVGSVAIFAGYR